MKWTIKQKNKTFTVKGNKHSFTINNKHDAEKLCNTLNTLEQTIQLHQNLDKQYDQITRQVIQLKLTINTLKEEINHLGDTINEINNTD